jgi:integrase
MMLTEISVRNLRPKATRYEKPDKGGLYLVVQPSGRKSYAVRFRVDGRSKKLTLPKGLTLAQARAQAAAALVQVERGIDPTAAKRRENEEKAIAARNTLNAVTRRFFEIEGGKLRSALWQQKLYERCVENTIGKQPIVSIRRKAIIELLDDVQAKSGAPTANSVLAIIRRVFGWYQVRDENFRSPIVRGMARIKPSEHERDRILNDVELRAVWRTAVKRDDAFSAFVRFLLLTAARNAEAARMKWGEINNGTDWVLPSERNKTKLVLVRPLSRAALDLVHARPKIEGCEFVFTHTGRTALSALSRCKREFDDASGVKGWRIHDLRRTSRSLLARAGVPGDHAEQCLGHVVGGVRGTYERHDFHREKHQAYEKLASLIAHIVNPPAGNVQRLRG